jgi:phenylacetic acid degradation protein paaN
MPDADQLASTARLADLVATHQPVLDAAVLAIRARSYWSAFNESPSTKIWGPAAPAEGKAAFEELLGHDFVLSAPGSTGFVGTERSPYGIALDLRYPRMSPDGVDELLRAAISAMPAWRDTGPVRRAAICIEMLRRIEARQFELAHAVMHTTGQGFVMAFQAGGAHALDRALEAIAYTYDAMAAIPPALSWEKPSSRGEAQRLDKTFTVIPRGVALVIACTTFPTWNSYPGLFASLVSGNPVVVKPHPRAVLPLAITVSIAQSVLTEYGFDPNLVTLAAEDDGAGLASVLATRPEVRIIDFTGSTAYGEWLEQNAPQAVVFTEKAGVNAVVIDSTSDLAAMAANLAYSLALYSGQMCTTPQVLLIPAGGIVASARHMSVDDFIAALADALAQLLGEPVRALAILGAIGSDHVLDTLATEAGLPGVAIESRSLHHDDFAAAQVHTPLVVKVSAADIARYGVERFGPVAFVVETRDTDHSFETWRALTETRGALTALVYSTEPAVIEKAEQIAIESGVSISSNLLADVYVNQTTAFSDFHATGANPAAGATITDAAFVSSRFRVVEARRPA